MNVREIFRSRGPPLMLAVGLVWLAVGAGDWFMRFAWFRWHQELIWHPIQPSAGPFAPMRTVDLPERRGGDLTHLIGIPSAEAEFEDVRAPAVEYSDEFGYRNIPPTTNTAYPVVVSGASYMNAGDPITNTLAARLSVRAGVPVYNHAFPGRGPFYGLLRFLEEPRFREHPPKVLVWGIVEREIGGDVFEGLVYQMRNLGAYTETGGAHVHFDWTRLKPKRLKHSLPDTSAIAQLSAKTWNKLRYDVLGQFSPDVAASDGTVEGRRFLFYTPAVRALKWTREERKIGQVVSAIKELDGVLKQRGTSLIILLVPDKEQVYRDLLPPRLLGPEGTLPASCLLELENELRAEGIPVVDMLRQFEALAAVDRMLYYRDDTHWDAEAIALAAERLNGEVSTLLKPR
jgi:hypothetical protein